MTEKLSPGENIIDFERKHLKLCTTIIADINTNGDGKYITNGIWCNLADNL